LFLKNRIPRHTWEGAELDGVTIPPGTTIYAAVDQIHHNPQYWPQPEQFIPERYYTIS